MVQMIPPDAVVPVGAVISVAMFTMMALSGQGFDFGVANDNYNTARINFEFQMFGVMLLVFIVFGFFIVVAPMLEANQRNSTAAVAVAHASTQAVRDTRASKATHKKSVHKAKF